MKISISNIAWDVVDDEIISRILIDNNVEAIDIAPMKYFPSPFEASDNNINKISDFWRAKGVEIIGMQSLFFGTNGLNMFGSKATQILMLKHLDRICYIGSKLGLKYLVFGSPKNRDRNNLADDEVNDISINFFRQLGDIASKYNLIICVEANPVIYGANFITSTEDAAALVQKVNHSNIKMQLDTSTIIINNENLEKILKSFSHLVGHIHASEPHLAIYGHENNVINYNLGQIIKKYLPDHFVTIEMLNSNCNNKYSNIERSIKTAKKCFN